MECNSLSALLSAANRENTVSLKERNGECIGVCVRGWEPSPRLRLWMSQKQSVGMPTDFSPFLCSSLSLVWGCWSNPITKVLLRRSGVPTRGGSVNWKTPLLNTLRWPQRPRWTHDAELHPSLQRGFLTLFSLTWTDAVTHQQESIYKSTHSLTLMATMSLGSASQLFDPKEQL